MKKFGWSVRVTWLQMTALLAVAAVLSMVMPSGVWGSESLRLSLRSGEIIEGRVFDLRQGELEVTRGLGARRVSKREVLTWDWLSGNVEAPSTAVLVFPGGREIAGNATLSAGVWTVKLPVGEATYKERDVARVLHVDGTATDGTFSPRAGFRERCAGILTELRGSSQQRQGALDFLAVAGFFAIPTLERLLAGELDDETQSAVRELYLSERYRYALAGELADYDPEFLTTLRNADTEQRLTLLRNAFLEVGDPLYPVLGVILLDSEQPPTVRSLAIDVLQRMGELQALVEAYNSSRGQAQLAVAVALGDSGIYVGIPTLLEAVQLEDVAVRRLAASKLTDYTGLDYGYDADASVEVRKTAVAKWQGWWRDNEQSAVEILAAKLGAGGGEARRARAVQLWRESRVRREKGESEAARLLLERATQSDPTYVAPLVSLGIISYQDDGNYSAAVDCFKKAIRRGKSPEDDEELRRAYFHLGWIQQKGLDFSLAESAYRKALAIAPEFGEAWLNLGICTYEQALRSHGSKEERRDAFLGAAFTFERGRDRMAEYRQTLLVLTRDQVPYVDRLPFSRRDYNISLLELRDNIKKLEADFDYRIARCYLAVEEFGKALEAAERAVQGPAPKSEYHLMAAKLLDRSGQSRLAEEHRRRAEELGTSPEN